MADRTFYDEVFEQLPESYRDMAEQLPSEETVPEKYRSQGVNLIYSAKTGRHCTDSLPNVLQEEPDYTMFPPVGALVPDHDAILNVLEGETMAYDGGQQHHDTALRALDNAIAKDIPVAYPCNFRDTVEERYGKRRADRVMAGIDELGQELDIYEHRGETDEHPSAISGDVMIAAAAEELSRFHEITVVMTNDAHHDYLADHYDFLPLPAVFANRVIQRQ